MSASTFDPRVEFESTPDREAPKAVSRTRVDDVLEIIPDARREAPLRLATTPPPRAVGTVDDPHRALRRYRRWAMGLDAAAAAIAVTVAVWARFQDFERWYAIAPLLAPVAWVGTIALYRAYEPRFLGSGPEEFRRVLNAGLIVFVAIAVGSYLLSGDVSRGIVLASIPATVAVSLLVRRLLRIRLHRARQHGRALQRVLVVGRADTAVGLIEQLMRLPSHGYLPVGVCVPAADVRPSHVREVPVIGNAEAVLSAVRQSNAHVVAVASHPDLSGQSLRRLSWALDELGVELLVHPGIVEVAGPRLSIRPMAELSLLHLERPATTGGWLLLKTVFDRVLGASMLAVLSPLLLTIALLVRVTSPGPALFRQVRVGADGREFTMFKFRSMVADADSLKSSLHAHDEGNGMLFKMRSDPRVTRVGVFLRRYSLDELPQLLNVVRGDMSLVGPRPPLPAEVEQYCDDATRRLRVRPGLTGLWQVSGRSDLSWEESLRLDLRYVDNWSLSLDLVILWRTLRAVLRGAGAY
jgi:exopolysaccharide biosynthesis polyprenyl glycosylphosphotransferase